MDVSRRNLLQVAAAALPAQLLGSQLGFAQTAAGSTASGSVPNFTADLYPMQPPELVREVVTVAHFDLKRIQELVGARPSLARAAWDWGFGDWEDALGAASHVGNRPIAEYLISQGARPTLFSATMLGQLDVVKAFIAAQPGAQRIRGPHSIPLLAHARFGGERAKPVFEYLQSLGDAGADSPPPLSDADIAGLVGTYVFGIGASQQVEISADKGTLNWARKGMISRGLIHLGDRVFHPMGAAAVRVRFADDAGTSVMTVHDPDVVLTARRKPVK